MLEFVVNFIFIEIMLIKLARKVGSILECCHQRYTKTLIRLNRIKILLN